MISVTAGGRFEVKTWKLKVTWLYISDVKSDKIHERIDRGYSRQTWWHCCSQELPHTHTIRTYTVKRSRSRGQRIAVCLFVCLIHCVQKKRETTCFYNYTVTNKFLTNLACRLHLAKYASIACGWNAFSLPLVVNSSSSFSLLSNQLILLLIWINLVHHYFWLWFSVLYGLILFVCAAG